jgi:DNA-binding NarL/FixJ family response regulator
VLSDDSQLQVIGEAQNGTDAVRIATAFQPDLVMMDVRMPGVDGLVATRTLKTTCPMISVLIMTMFEDADLLLEAIKVGAAGYVLKSASSADIRSAVWAALDGNFPVDPQLARLVLARLSHEHVAPVHSPSATGLSAREHEVLERVARGQSNREIGDELVVTPSTVKKHLEHIMAKLGVSDRTQAAVRAIELGYIVPLSAQPTPRN